METVSNIDLSISVDSSSSVEDDEFYDLIEEIAGKQFERIVFLLVQLHFFKMS